MSPARPELAVGAIVVENDALLLIRRAQRPAVGRWSVPGGRVEAGERVHDALVREVREETSVAITVGELAGWVERIGGDDHFVILDFFARPSVARQTPIPGDDASAAAWVPFGEVAGLDLVDGLLDFLRQVGSVGP